MKRSEALAPLSRDHQHGLAAALRLRRATPETAAADRSAFLAFWESEGRHHFHVEEDVLLPGFARYGPPDHPDVVRTLVEHVDLRRRADELARDAALVLDALHVLGERLNAHIRREENVLFPLIERALPPGELVALGERIAAAERQ